MKKVRAGEWFNNKIITVFFVGKIFRLYILNKFARTIIFFLLISDLLIKNDLKYEKKCRNRMENSAYR